MNSASVTQKPSCTSDESITGSNEYVSIIQPNFLSSGNAPTAEWFVGRIKDAVRRGIVVLNVTQCHAGKVDMDAYATGIALKKEGVISGYDSTTEAALTKMFYVLGQSDDLSIVKELLNSNLRGEISN